MILPTLQIFSLFHNFFLIREKYFQRSQFSYFLLKFPHFSNTCYSINIWRCVNASKAAVRLVVSRSSFAGSPHYFNPNILAFHFLLFLSTTTWIISSNWSFKMELGATFDVSAFTSACKAAIAGFSALGSFPSWVQATEFFC